MVAGKNVDIPGSSSAAFSGSPPNITSGPPLPAMPSGIRTGQLRSASGQFAGGMYVVWGGLDAVFALPDRVGADLIHATDAALEQLQTDMVEFAQQNAPWNDVTGDARAELHSPAITTASDGTRTVVLAHGVSYGVHLETMDGGVWGVIPMTIREFESQLVQRIGDEVSR